VVRWQFVGQAICHSQRIGVTLWEVASVLVVVWLWLFASLPWSCMSALWVGGEFCSTPNVHKAVFF